MGARRGWLELSHAYVQQPIAACTRAQTLTRTCPLATCNGLLHPPPTSAQDGLDPLQLVVFLLIPYMHTYHKEKHCQVLLLKWLSLCC